MKDRDRKNLRKAQESGNERSREEQLEKDTTKRRGMRDREKEQQENLRTAEKM